MACKHSIYYLGRDNVKNLTKTFKDIPGSIGNTHYAFEIGGTFPTRISINFVMRCNS